LRSLIALSLATATLSACMHLPNSVATSPTTEATYGAADENTSLMTILRQDGIAPIDPASNSPVLDQTRDALAKSDPDGRFQGITYHLTHDNSFAKDWLVQTPDAWGRATRSLPIEPLNCPGCDPDFHLATCQSDADCAAPGSICARLAAAGPTIRHGFCLGQSDRLIDRIYALVAGARRSVDITTLQPAPDFRFLAALRNGMTRLARSHRPVTVRLLVGQYPPEGVDAKAVLGELVRDARKVRGAHLAVYVAAMRSCTGSPSCGTFSWNHSKILAIDGATALVGGHNMWTQDYLLDDPVSDLSMVIHGTAASDAVTFADALWRFVCGPHKDSATVSAFAFHSANGTIAPGCLADLPPPPARAAPTNGTAILSVGRLGAGITERFANQNDLARNLLFGAARQSIRVAQQDIGFSLLGQIDAIYPDSTLEQWADFMLAGRGDVYVVLSNLGALGRSKSTYSNALPLSAVAEEMLRVTRLRSSASRETLAAMLCQRFHLAPYRFGPDAAWPDKNPVGNHGKFWMVDDRYFYIGSDNLYPVDLQEFGYIVDDRARAKEILETYWDPLWQWSRAAAISGSDAPTCVLAGAPVAKPRQ
jgi:phosphatidylserine/phosphatidylglycerophosphate/cardiolipin synthase-like enzyme